VESSTNQIPENHHPCVLDHIRPIAMGGDQWARRISRSSAGDASGSGLPETGEESHGGRDIMGGVPAHEEDNSRQVVLF